MPRTVKPLLFVLALVPLARLFLLGYEGRLGANPVEMVTRSTGYWTLVFLCLTLLVSPLRWLTGVSVLIRLRRMLGLFAMFYAMLHFLTWVWFDQWFSLPDMLADIVKRPFITVGFLAFVLLLPLAATSTQAMMRRLGRRWSQLHRLIYPIAMLGVLHYWWLKADKNALADPKRFAVIVLILLAARAGHAWWTWRRRPPAPAGR